MFLVRAVYYSTAALPASPKGFDEGVEAILETAERNNPAEGLTGALAYDDGQFIQVLEGPREAVSKRLFAIAADERHTGMTLVEFAEISRRRFSDWTMAFVNRDTARRVAPAPDWLSYAPSESILALLEAAVAKLEPTQAAE